MKKTSIILASLLFVCFGAIPSYAASGTIQKPPTSMAMQPDLTVKIDFKVTQHTNANGIICFSLQPIYTVANNGMSVAKNFRVKLEWKWPQKTNWEACSFRANTSLGPGKSRTWEPSAAEEIHWCKNDTKHAGFRVTADDQNKVAETKENNNTATKMYPYFKIKKQ